MQFDWIRFLQHHRIEYVTSGSNVAAGNIAVHCPYCGSTDPSYHMGVSLKGYGFGCWRNKTHRGKDPARLIAALLSISLVQARSMIGSTTVNVSDLSLQDRVASLLKPNNAPTVETELTFPSEIKRLDWANRKPRMFFDYLYTRGYTEDEAQVACQKFGLRYALTGDFAYRIIFPIRNADNELVSWTGRAIASDQSVRYKTLSTRHGAIKARGSITDYLLREHHLIGGRILVVCEGPFDAMRIETVCNDDDVAATCLFTKTASENQIAKLAQLSKNFRDKFLLLDQDAELSSLSVLERLRNYGYSNIHLPKQFKDPAETPNDVLRQLLV